MAPIVVDPEVLAGAGVSVSSVGDEIAAAVNTLAAALPNGAMAGHDRAGLAFGQVYHRAAQALMDAGGAAASGGRKLGFGVQLSATNYSRADASSTIGGGGVPLTPPSAPGEFDAPSVPSPFGGGVAEPFLWSMVEMFVGDVWPNGDPAQLRAAGTAWSAFARSMAGIAAELEGPSSTISGQQIPEGGAIASDLSELKKYVADICTESARLGVQLFEFATDVESAQNAIRDLLGRLSPSGIFDAIGSIFSGDAMEELREIADDIRAVLDNLGRQADARQHALQEVTNLLDGAIVSLQQKARKEFTDFLGEDVGNAVATYFDINTNVLEAPLKVGLESIGGIQALDPLRFAYDFEGAKETWGALEETASYANPLVALTDPIGAFEHGKAMAEGFAHVEDWSTDRPGLGPAMAATEIASMVIPGAGISKATKAADVAGDIAEAGPAVRAAGVVDNAVTDTAAIAGRAEGITEKLDHIGDNLMPNASPDAPGPAIPRDLAEPPRIGDAPSPQPRVPDAPPPHVPDSTPGDRTPVAPHNSTPTEAPRAPVDTGSPTDRAPAATPAQSADVPAGSQNSAPSASPAASPSDGPPPPGVHAQEPVPAAAHAPSSASPSEGSSIGHLDQHGPSSSGDAPEGGNSGSANGPGNDDFDGSPSASSGVGDNHSASDGSDGNGHSPGPDTQPDGHRQDPVHSDQQSGDGWHRVTDDPADPHYGQPLTEHWQSGDYPTRNDVNRSTFDLVERPDEPYGHDSDGNSLTKHEYDERSNKIGPEGQPWNNYPPNAGAVPGTRVAYDSVEAYIRDYGPYVDRVGRPSGEYLAVMPDGMPLSFEGRSLPIGSLEQPYFSYALNGKALPEGWTIEVSEIAPAFGRDGGGLQVVVLDELGQEVLISAILGKILK